MTPSARLEAAIEILGALETTALPADRFIRDWFRRRRYAGSKDRAAVAERVFDILRHRGSSAWRMRRPPALPRGRGRRPAGCAGTKDRAAVAERVFDILRHRGSYAWRMRSAAPRSL